MMAKVPFWNDLRSKGDACAISDLDRRIDWTYRELAVRVHRTAAVLRRHPRALLLLLANNDAAGILIYLSALQSGHAAFLCPTSLAPSAAAPVLSAYRPELLVCPQDVRFAAMQTEYALDTRIHGYTVWKRRENGGPPLHPDVALVLTTSASTGSPKAVCLSARNITGSADQVAGALSVSGGDRWLLSLPVSYVYGLSVLHSCLHRGATVVLAAGSWAQGSYYEKIAAGRITAIPCVTQTLDYMREHGITARSLPTLKRLTHSGSRLDPGLFFWTHDTFGSKGVDLHLMYGQTEACGRITVLNPRALPELHRSVGQPIPPGTLELGHSGEIIYRGPGVMLGYATSRAELALGDVLQGVLHTGDIGRFDHSGNLFITGRLSRICKVFGKRVSLDDIEALFRGDANAAAAVEKDGVVAVFLERSETLPAAAIMRIAKRLQLPPQSFRIRVISALPRNERGKITYSILDKLA